MNAAQPTKSICGHAHAFEIRQLDPPVIADHHIFNVALAIYKRANLPARFMRQFRQLPSKLGGNNFSRRNSAGIQLLDPPQLIGLQPQRVPKNVSDSSTPNMYPV